MSPVLEVENLAKAYWDFRLDDVSLAVAKGRVVGIIGPNGAGKTTLINLIMDLLPATSGTVRAFGLSYGDSEKKIKNRIGYVGEDPPFYMHKTVAWTGRFAARFFERWDGNRFSGLLADFSIDQRKKVGNLSRGRKTLLALAVALSHEADLFVLDEPTAGLDAVIRRDVLRLLKGLVEDEEKTALIASHNTDGLADVADDVAFLNTGKLVLRADKDELLAGWKWLHYKEGSLNRDVLETLSGVRRQPFGNSALTRDFPNIRDRLSDGVAVGDVKVENASLDDILISLVKGG
jgi:ABC-2 type transport system ATP-binding protein